MSEEQTLEAAKDKLKELLGFTVFSHNAQNTWFHLIDQKPRVGCILMVEEDGNQTFQFIVNKTWGEFKYLKFNIHFLFHNEDAVKLAYERCNLIGMKLRNVY